MRILYIRACTRERLRREYNYMIYDIPSAHYERDLSECEYELGNMRLSLIGTCTNLLAPTQNLAVVSRT